MCNGGFDSQHTHTHTYTNTHTHTHTACVAARARYNSKGQFVCDSIAAAAGARELMNLL